MAVELKAKRRIQSTTSVQLPHHLPKILQHFRRHAIPEDTPLYARAIEDTLHVRALALQLGELALEGRGVLIVVLLMLMGLTLGLEDVEMRRGRGVVEGVVNVVVGGGGEGEC